MSVAPSSTAAFFSQYVFLFCRFSCHHCDVWPCGVRQAVPASVPHTFFHHLAFTEAVSQCGVVSSEGNAALYVRIVEIFRSARSCFSVRSSLARTTRASLFDSSSVWTDVSILHGTAFSSAIWLVIHQLLGIRVCTRVGLRGIWGGQSGIGVRFLSKSLGFSVSLILTVFHVYLVDWQLPC